MIWLTLLFWVQIFFKSGEVPTSSRNWFNLVSPVLLKFKSWKKFLIIFSFVAWIRRWISSISNSWSVTSHFPFWATNKEIRLSFCIQLLTLIYNWVFSSWHSWLEELDNPLSTEYFEIGGRGELLYLFPCILLFLSVLNFFQVKELKLYYLITDSGYKTPSIAYFLLSQNWIIIRLPLLTQSKRLPQATLLLTCDNQLLCEFECIEENSVLESVTLN